MNKVHIDSVIYYNGEFRHISYGEIIKRLFYEYGIRYIYSVPVNLRCFVIIDESKFILFALKYSEYIDKILK